MMLHLHRGARALLWVGLCLFLLLAMVLSVSCGRVDPVVPDEEDETEPLAPPVDAPTEDTPPEQPVVPEEIPEYYYARGEKWEFVPTAHYPADDVIVCVKNVLKFGAKPDGSTDATKAFQKALDAAAAMGGGTVYAPAGQYYFKDHIVIPDTVVLCGDWISPTEAPAGSGGTILIFDYKSRTPQAQYGYINLGSSSGLRNVTVYHMNQSFEQPLKLAPTVWGYHHTSPTVENVTILNAYVGFSFGEAENSNSSLVTMSNVYVSALSCGILLGNSYDVSRLENVHLSPEYLAENAIRPLDEAQKEALYAYTFANCTGMVLYRGDATSLYGTYLAELKVGLLFDEDPGGNGVTSGSVVKTEIRNCDVGVQLNAAHFVGTALTGFTATASRPCTAAVATGRDYTYHAKIENGSIAGQYQHAAMSCGKAALSFTDIVFDLVGDKAVFLAERGVISCAFCRFENETIASDGGGYSAVYLSDCETLAECGADMGAQSVFEVKQTAAIYEPIKGYHVYRDALPGPARRAVVSVSAYGAKGDGRTDCTAAIQAALDDMAKQGGGIVLLSSGKYVVKGHLTVPTGVELTGLLGSWAYSASSTKSSCLLLYAGADDPDGRAAISLESGSGLRGFTAWYPEQNIDDVIAYSYAIRSLGKDTYVVNVNICNAYQYMDLSTYPSEGHYIRNCGGMAIRRGISVGNNEGEGWIENVHLNQHQIYGLQVAGEQGGYAPDQFDHAVYDLLIYEMEGFVFGYTENEHVLGTFCLGSCVVYLFEEQDGKSASGTFVQIGADGCSDSIVVKAANELNLIAPGNVALGDESSKTYLRTYKSLEGTVNLWGGTGYGSPTQCMILGGGTIHASTFGFSSFQGSTPLLLTGTCSLHMVNCVMPFPGNGAKAVMANDYAGTYEEAATLVSANTLHGYAPTRALMP